jgi:hypothetical protein
MNNYARQLLALNDEQLEEFVRGWVGRKTKQYVEVTRSLSANVAETPASLKFSVEGEPGSYDDESDGEADRGVREGDEASVHDGGEDSNPA